MSAFGGGSTLPWVGTRRQLELMRYKQMMPMEVQKSTIHRREHNRQFGMKYIGRGSIWQRKLPSAGVAFVGSLVTRLSLQQQSKCWMVHMNSQLIWMRLPKNYDFWRLQELEMHSAPLSISAEKWQEIWRKAKGETSSSQSGLHLGHYKAAAECDFLSKFHAVKTTLALKRVIALS